MPAAQFFLIDSFGFIFRAYHARAHSGAPAMRTAAGLSTEAVFIFTNMLRRLIRQYDPPYLAAVFESLEPTLRSQEFAEYKANRPEAPAELVEQIPYIRRVLEAMRVPVVEFAGYEADDVIGTLARRAQGEGFEVVIVSSDKDLMQLVSSGVSMLNPAKDDEWYDPEKVQAFLGVPPERVTDLLALKGDAVDNIPGAPGIGEKGARELIERFGDIEAAIERAGEVPRKAYRESLQNNAESIRLSKRLATIATDVPIEFALERAQAQPADPAALTAVYRELEFHSLLTELGREEAAGGDYRPVVDAQELRAWLAEAGNSPVAVELRYAGGAAAPPPPEPTSDSQETLLESAPPGEPALAAIGLAWRLGEGRCLGAELLPALQPWLEDECSVKIACDVKSALVALDRAGIAARGFTHDVMLYAFLLEADPGGCSLDEQARRKLDLKLDAAPERRAEAALRLRQRLEPALDERGLRKLYSEIELPLARVLARMERVGIRISREALREISARMEGDIARLTAEIHALAGRPFNINSTQQLGQVLYDELKLPAPVRRGKGKVRSTAADVLEELAAHHEIVRKTLDYRQLVKLKGTYVDALPALIDPRTGRVHTRFNQAGAATGRLSSSNPNLQNIPIRTELGREIRAAFLPREGWKLVTADYSQIELRLLAHMSGDPLLVEAFRQGEDIHARTAAEVLGVAPELVTPEARRAAKAVNFGIVYGISAFGLASQLGISQAEAERYIQHYFERYAGVRRFLDETIAAVRASGVARTLFGRERPIPDMHSGNAAARGFAERTAVNTPLQGSAADLIKLAMTRVDAALEAGGFRSAMLLQVHDELVFECPPEEVPAVCALARRAMEGAYALTVPLVVDIGVGENWRDAK